jgi:anti-sigma factor RsiW
VTPIGEAELQAYTDNRLPDECRRAVEAWLDSHPDDAARIAAYRVLGEQLRAAYAPVLEERVPAELLAVLHAKKPKRRWRLPAAIAAGCALMALGAWQISEHAPHYLPGNPAVEMVRRASLAHAVYAPEVNHPVEARSRDQLLQWLSERLQMKVQAPSLEAAGLAFIGGRLLPGERAPAALLMYEGANGQRVTLYWGPEFRRERETGLVHARADNGTRLYYWLDDECAYAIASAELDEKELLRIAKIAYAQLEK